MYKDSEPANGAPGLSSSAVRLSLLLLVGIGVGGALVLAGLRELTLDEFHTWQQTRLPFRGLVRFVLGDVHPPAYLSTTWLWTRVMPDSPIGLRSISALWYGASIATVAAIGLTLWGDRARALYAAGAFGFSQVALSFGAHARAYALLTFVGALLTLAFIYASDDRRALAWAVLAGVLAALMAYVHYVGLFFAAGIYALWAAKALRDRRWRRVLSGLSVSAVCFAPWLPTLWSQYSERRVLAGALNAARADPSALLFDPEGVASVTIVDSATRHGVNLARIGAQLLGVIPSSSTALLALSAVTALLVGAGVLALLVRRDRIVQGGVLVALVTAVGNVLLGLTEPKYFAVLAPIVAVIGTQVVFRDWGKVGLTRLGRGLGYAWPLVLIIGFGRLFQIDYGHPTTALVEYVDERYETDDLVLFSVAHGEIPFEYYALRTGFSPATDGFPRSLYEQWADPNGFMGWSMDIPFQQDLQRLHAELSERRVRRVWLVLFESGIFDPHDRLLSSFEERGDEVVVHRGEEWDGTYRLREVVLRE